MEKKQVPARNYFMYTTKTTLNKLMDVANAEVSKLYSKAAELQLKQSGAVEFIYFDCTADREKEFTLEIALPIEATEKKISGDYKILQHENFDCVSYIHKGSMDDMVVAYEKIYTQLWNESKRPSNQIREVYTHYVDAFSPENITEIQIGIQG